MTILYEITFQFFLSDTIMLTNDCHGVIRVEILAHPSENKTDGGNVEHTPPASHGGYLRETSVTVADRALKRSRVFMVLPSILTISA